MVCVFEMLICIASCKHGQLYWTLSVIYKDIKYEYHHHQKCELLN